MKRLISLILAAILLFVGTASALGNDCLIDDISIDKPAVRAGDRVTVMVEVRGPGRVIMEGVGIRFIEPQKEIAEQGALYFAAVILDETFEIQAQANGGVAMVYESGDFE